MPKMEDSRGAKVVDKNIKNIESLITPSVEALGCHLWGVELQGGINSRMKVVIYIDSEKGVDIDDCAAVSEQLSDVLDMEEFIPSSYTLEVSSPGLDRILFNEGHFRESIGLKVDVRLARSFEGQRKLTGILMSCNSSSIKVKDDLSERVIPIEAIRKVRVVPEI